MKDNFDNITPVSGKAVRSGTIFMGVDYPRIRFHVIDKMGDYKAMAFDGRWIVSPDEVERKGYAIAQTMPTSWPSQGGVFCALVNSKNDYFDSCKFFESLEEFNDEFEHFDGDAAAVAVKEEVNQFFRLKVRA